MTRFAGTESRTSRGFDVLKMIRSAAQPALRERANIERVKASKRYAHNRMRAWPGSAHLDVPPSLMAVLQPTGTGDDW